MGAFLVLGIGAIGFFLYWLLLRERPADRPAIEEFAGQHGLRIVSVRRSYNHWGHWLRGRLNVSNIARLYDVAVEDSERNQSLLRLAFDPLFKSGRMDVLEHRQSASAGQDGSKPFVSLVPPVKWAWSERLVLFGGGAGVGGFIFCGILSGQLMPPDRPIVPDPAHGYTYLFTIKQHNVYGTYFEYLAMTRGHWITWGFAAVCGLFAYTQGIHHKSPTASRQVFAAAAVSFVLYFAIWKMFFSGA